MILIRLISVIVIKIHIKCIYGKETQELFVEKGVYACNVIISYCTSVTVYLIKSKTGCKIS